MYLLVQVEQGEFMIQLFGYNYSSTRNYNE